MSAAEIDRYATEGGINLGKTVDRSGNPIA
jgi:hypothetical protein